MLLLEADAKRLMRRWGVPTPASVLVRPGDLPESPTAGSKACVVKAQVPVGGRGKAGGIVVVHDASRLDDVVQKVFDTRVKGYQSKALLIEEAVEGAEHYLAFMVDAAAGAMRIMYSPEGGVEIETAFRAAQGNVNLTVPATSHGVEEALSALRTAVDPSIRESLLSVASKLCECVRAEGLLLAEINPLFVRGDGTCVAGDAKVVVDMNAVPDRKEQFELFREHQDLYPDAWRKLSEGFDYVDIDLQGEIGLVTTGAGLSMMLIDELVAAGAKPINFCDLRTGQMRGKPDRLLRVLDWLAMVPTMRVILVNVFAGITDLGEFAELLLEAMRRRPDLNVPVVARLVGNGAARAEEIITPSGARIVWEPQLDRAIARAAVLAKGSAHVA